MREHEAAADALARALELAKQGGTPSAQLVFQYADALVLAGRLDQALEVAEELSLPAHQHLIRARVAQERHDPARALQEFDAGLLLWPDNPWARYQAATAAEELGDFDRALEEFRQSIRISPDATDARIRGATLLLAEGKPRKAIELLHAGDAKAALGPEAKLLSVRLSALLGNMSAVRATLEQLNAVHPTWVGRGLAEAADSLALRGGPKVALGMLASAPMVDYKEPVYAEALHALVRYAHEAGQPESVRSVLEESLAAHPDSSVFLEVRGLDLELSGRSDAALEAYQRAVDLEPGNAFALAGLARLALREEDTAAAVELFDRAAAADTRDPDPMLAAARALAASGDTDQAAARLDKLLRLHPYETDAALERARLDLEQGVATGRTLERAQRAVRFRGGPEALELLSRVYAQRGEEELSAQAAERARELREARAEG
jgi:tetratricopeptide (TPR) repeat protein